MCNNYKMQHKKLLFISAGTLVSLVFLWLVLRFSPYPALNSFLARPNSIRYYDRYGTLLQITPLADGIRRETPQVIPQYVKDVFVFSEDRRFYSHPGIDVFSLVRAVYQNISRGRRVSGASTITMQLARLVSNYEHQETNPSLHRKIAEIFNALRLEARLSKDQILELYLISLPFGFNSEGVGTAARTFFGNDLTMLSPAQIFCLAVIPRRPNLYNPHNNPDNCISAAKILQNNFSANKKLNSSWPLFVQINEHDWEYTASSVRRFNYPFEFPHLIRYVNSQILKENVLTGEIYLSADLVLQHYLENAIAGNVMQLHSSRITNGAAVVIDNETGEILAWVGSADFHNSQTAGQVDGVLALNQPGSSMKPFLYAMALENGFKPTDVIADVLMNFGNSEVYIPRNFNERFNGPILFRTSLASSLNIPAVYLLYRLGVQNYTSLLYSLGFDSLERSADNVGLGLALGNAPVSLLELVRAFSVFPRDGKMITDTFFVDEEHTAKTIFSKDTARLICAFLSDSNARVLAFGAGRSFRTSFPAMFKTGTANQYQSIVALGATQRYTAGVWMGNFIGETVIGRTGSSVPAAIVRDALNFLQGQIETGFFQDASFPPPDNWHLRKACAVSGMIPTEACISVIDEYAEHGETEIPCTWHYVVNGRSETVFPAEYQSWFNAMTRQGTLDYSSRPLEIISPRDGFVYLLNPGHLQGVSVGIKEIPVEVIGGEGDVLHITHNDRTFTINRPFVFYLPCIPGRNRLHVKCNDEEYEILFTVD